VPRLREQHAGMRADIAEAAGDQDAACYFGLPGFSAAWLRMRA